MNEEKDYIIKNRTNYFQYMQESFIFKIAEPGKINPTTVINFGKHDDIGPSELAN